MRLLFLLLLGCGLASSGFAQDKAAFDVQPPLPTGQEVQQAAKGVTGFSDAANTHLEASLSRDAYFTLGTTAEGASASLLDDRAQLTFGHPHAFTSFPYVVLNGTTLRFDQLYASQLRRFAHTTDTLRVVFDDPQAPLHTTFALEIAPAQPRARLRLTVLNADAVAHTVQPGLVFDPALGQWGDGHARAGTIWATRDTVWASGAPPLVEVWERASGAMGLGVQLDFRYSEMPQQLRMGNWFDVYEGRAATGNPLYDLTMDAQWAAVTLAPGDEVEVVVELALLPPDDPDGLFLRADLPRYFTLSGDRVAPSPRSVMARVINTAEQSVNGVALQFEGGTLFEPQTATADLSVLAGGSTYTLFSVMPPEVFEDLVVPVSVSTVANGQAVDRLQVNTLIPGVPFSDEGLTIEIDSVAATATEASVFFTPREEATGRLIPTLQDRNVFLFEDQARISDFTIARDSTGSLNQADVVFVLDVSGSMGNEIAAVRSNIVEFADSLTQRGIDYRLGLVAFRDAVTEVSNFTDDVDSFRGVVGRQTASGGGDRPENSLDAIDRAAQFAFRPTAQRVLIWITDADYYEGTTDTRTQHTAESIVGTLLREGITLYSIGNTRFQTDFYDPVYLPTGGLFFDIDGNFRDILLQLSRLRTSGQYVLSYQRPSTTFPFETTVEVHVAGLGGTATAMVAAPTSNRLSTVAEVPEDRATLDAFPNPFHQAATFQLTTPAQRGGTLEVFNVLGQRVHRIPIPPGPQQHQLTWTAEGVASGLYFVRATVRDALGGSQRLAARPLVLDR
ncbi:MAG: VWA domain-containing protein [Bacteroidota bacterium]